MYVNICKQMLTLTRAAEKESCLLDTGPKVRVW